MNWKEKIEQIIKQIIEPIKEKPNQSSRKTCNQEIMLVMYLFSILFLLLIGNYLYFIFFKGSEVINNTYNKRQDLLAERVVRGDILGSKGQVLATTTEDKEGNSTRSYPYNNLFVHIVGRMEKGRTGIESTENFKLLTSNMNPILKMIKEFSGEKNPGDNIMTTLDVELQQIAYEALGKNKGAVVVLEPTTGKILTMLSKPDYNPNDINSIWDTIVEDDNSPLLNRATQGLYAPGSTFKILTTLEYIRENANYKNYQYNCSGSDIFSDITINCYNKRVHGEIDLKQSFAYSCNTSFANIGMTLNLKSFHALCDSLLFNKSLPLPMSYQQSSFVLDENSKKKEIPQTAMGQGKTEITPIHNALIVSAIANGGILMKPYVVDSIINADGDTVKKYMPKKYGSLLTSEEAEQLTEYMKAVVTEGTAPELKSSQYMVAGKTGTAEYLTKEGINGSHSWFVGFAMQENKKVVVSIVIEGTASGGDKAIPVARKIFDLYYK